jgi:hypothetical protein
MNRLGREVLPTDPPDGNESDDDVSVTDEPPPGETEGLQGSLDTIPLSTTDRAGEMKADEDMCRVILAAKNPEGQILFCGYPALLCKRRTHQEKKLDLTKRTDPGVYAGVLSSNHKVVDGIVESFLSFEDREKRSLETLRDMEAALYSSVQKKAAEDAYHPKTPSTLSFNLEEQPPSTNRSHQLQMQEWRQGLGETPSPPLGSQPPTPGRNKEKRFPPPPTKSSTDQSVIATTLERLALSMEQKLDRMQTHQELLNQGRD